MRHGKRLFRYKANEWEEPPKGLTLEEFIALEKKEQKKKVGNNA